MTSGIRRRTIALLFGLALVWSLAPAAADIRFAVIADTHIGAGSTASADLSAVVSRINGLSGVHFAVLAGDITEKGRDSEFAEAKRLLGGLKIPWHVIAGNHDAHWIGQALIGFREAWASDRFFFEKSGRVFIGLNTWDFGHLAPDDLVWLRERLAGTAASARFFVFAHHPPALVDNWYQAQNILKARKSVIFSGHVHRTQILSIEGLPFVTIRRAMASTLNPPGFGLIDSRADGRVSVFEVNGNDAPRLVGTIGAEALGAASEIPPPVRTRDEVEVVGRAELETRASLAPVSAGDRIIVVDNAGRIHGFDSSARERWIHDPKAFSASRPVGRGRFAYAATAKGRILKLETADGRLVDEADVGERVTSALALFADGSGRRRLLAGTLSGRLFCLDAQSLDVLWVSGEAKDMIQSRPLVVGEKVIFGCWDARLHALEVSTGRPLWRWSENDNFYYAPAGCDPVSDGSRIFVSCPDGFVSAVDLTAGRTVWREKHNAWESLGLSPDRARLFIKSRADEFRLLDSAAGRLLALSSPAQGKGDIMPVEPVEWEGRVYFGVQNGRIYEVGPGGRMKAILDLGPAGVHSLLALGGGRFAAVNLDGTLVVFRVSPRDGGAGQLRSRRPR